MGASFSLAAHRLKQGLAASGQRKTRQNLAGFWLLVIPARFERATVCLEGRCCYHCKYLFYNGLELKNPIGESVNESQ